MLERFFRSGLGIFILTGIVVVSGAGSMVGYQIYTLSHPPRVRGDVRPSDLLLRFDDVTFQSTDGVSLSGWLIHGDPDAPALLLCHDLGESKSVFLDAAVTLQRAGFNLLLMDFRGHGDSAGKGSTFGTEERYDVLGAVDFLRSRRDLAGDRLGIWGIGMGAYAAVLSASERKEVIALALDSIYPDVATFLDEALFRGLPPAAAGVTAYASVFYAPYFQWRISTGAVGRALPQLSDRDFLFVAGTERPGALAAAKRLYESLGEGGQADRNLLELGRSGLSGLYAEDRRKYEEAIAGFFGTYLKIRPEPVPKGIQVREH